MKIPKPGVDLFLPFFDRLGFGLRCLGEKVVMLAQFHALGFSLSSYRASKCHIPNNLFFSISPFPYRTTYGQLLLTVSFDWCWLVIRDTICR